MPERLPTSCPSRSVIGLGCLVVLALASQLPAYFWDPSNLATVAMGKGGPLTPSDAGKFLAAGIKSFPKAQQDAAAEYAFLLATVTRVEGNLFVALGLSALYTLSLPFKQRASLHLFGAIFATGALLMNCNHAGYLDYGANAFTTKGAKEVASGLVGFWAVATPRLWGAWFHSPGGGRKDE